MQIQFKNHYQPHKQNNQLPRKNNNKNRKLIKQKSKKSEKKSHTNKRGELKCELEIKTQNPPKQRSLYKALHLQNRH